MNSLAFNFNIRTAVLLVLSLLLAGCSDENVWRQKLTVYVDTPSGLVSGSSVIEVHSKFGKSWPSGNEVAYKISGEATVVELLNGQYLFALLGDTSEAERFHRAFYPDWQRDRQKRLNAVAEMQGTSVTLKPKQYPRLVQFGDIGDPASVKRVEPDDLAATFGEGYVLKSITLEITEERVTEGRIENILAWATGGNPKLEDIWQDLRPEQRDMILALKDEWKRNDSGHE